MTKEFIPYEIALELKEFGFDDPCFGYYTEDKVWRPASYSYEGTEYPWNSVWIYTTAPLYQQAFRWFIDKHELEAVTEQSNDYTLYKFTIYKKSNFYTSEGCKTLVSAGFGYKTYEEAELECLKQLIKIVNNYDRRKSF